MPSKRLLTSIVAVLLLGAIAPASSFAASSTPDNIFGNSTPTKIDSGDRNSVELGVKFTAAQSGTITGIRFYKSTANTGDHVVSLWSAGGTLLAQATSSGETASGWQSVDFSSPVEISSGSTYIAGYFDPHGHYSATTNGLGSAVTNGPLTALGTRTSANGVYAYSHSSTFPTSSYQANNYWVDVNFVPDASDGGTTTNPAPPSTTPSDADSVFGSVTPAQADSGDGNAVELGVKFSSSQPGTITGIRFYKSARNGGTHVGSLWSAGGSLLAQATFADETASGWQSVSFSSPVAISANTTYVAGYYAPDGHYAALTNGLGSSVTNGPLTALGSGSSADGVYAYSSGATFPTYTYHSNNYYVDVDFVPGSQSSGTTTAPAPTPPTPTATTPTPPPAPTPPTNTATPAITGTATEGQTLSVSTGSWTGSPTGFTYQWQDCSGADCSDVPGATSNSYTLGAGDVGDTVDAVVTATNAGGSTSATTAQTDTVAAPQPAAPTNMAAPAVTGTATQGQILSVSTGTWTGSPTGYSYQWQDCSGASCTNVTGATGNSYTLGAGDVGDTVDAVVTATNAGGSAHATTNKTATVASSSAGSSGPETDCFADPGSCGYPDPSYSNVGATSSCSSLPSSGSVTASTNGQTVQNLNITGTLTISAPNVTVNNVCVTASGNYEGNGVNIGSNASNLLIENTTVSGTSASGTGVLNTGVFNPSNIGSVTLNKVYITNAAEAYHGSGTIENSYFQAGAVFTIPSGSDGCSTSGGCISHNEDIYLSDTSVTIEHDTLLNSASQTAVLFGDNNGGTKGKPADNHWVVEDSLLAGGGFLAYMNAGATAVGSSTMTIDNNRFARCLGATSFNGWGTTCTDAPSTSGGTTGDNNGYYPYGGYYGGVIDDYCPSSGSGQVWSDNVWDDNNAAVGCS
jgi:Domain of unknown function (DUF4082)